MRVLIIDNYDSFTFNLYQDVGESLTRAGAAFELQCVRNDELRLDEIKQSKWDRIIVSPGPGDPADRSYFGVCGDVLLAAPAPILGVCLGMQGMAHYYGGRVVRAKLPMHGKRSVIEHNGEGVFVGLPEGLEVMRYHSLIAERESLPKEVEVTSWATESGEIMGLRHRTLPVEGIQFHPESFATEGGRLLIENFLFRPWMGADGGAS